MQYSNLEKWKKACEKHGYKVRTITRATHCDYYQATNRALIVGFFNDFKKKKPFGTLLEPSDPT